MVEITHCIDLCDNKGRLNPDAIGWSKKPLINCNLKGHFLRKKRWNYWGVYDKNFLFSATISNVDYLREIFCYYLDFSTKIYYEKTFIIPFSPSTVIMSDDILGKASFSSKKTKVDFINKKESTFINVHIPGTPSGDLEAEIEVHNKDLESLNVVIPWSDNRFQFTSKQFCLPAEGYLKIGQFNHEFKIDETFATLDFGRGVWKYSTFWNWNSFSAKLEDGNTVGVNLGGGWTEGTGMNENGMLINGKLSKIFEDIEFEYDNKDFMKPWHIYTKGSNMVDLVLSPFFERKAKTNLLLISSEFHQVFGNISGVIKDNLNRLYKIDRSIGWVEEHMARW